MSLILLIVVALLIIYWFFNGRNVQSKISSVDLGKKLPGPWNIPIFGHVPMFFAKRPYQFFNNLAKKYGPILQLKVGGQSVVILNNLPIIKKALNESSFTDRPNLPSLIAMRTDGRFHRQIFMQANEQWKFYRKNSIKALALFASSKNSRLNALVEQGCRSLHKDFDANLERPFNPKQSIFECVAGIIGAINFGFQFDRKDPLLTELVEFTEKVSKSLEVASCLDYFPACHWLLSYKIEQIRSIAKPISQLITSHLEKHEFNTENVADIADALYKRSREITPQEYEAIQLTPEHLQQAAQDLFMAGFSSIVETLLWCLAFMAKYPDVQKKVHEELDQVYGRFDDQFPSVDDRASTPYTEAIILEVFRLSSFVPLALPHATTHDFSFEGYHIPGGAVVLPNLWAVHHDEEIFPDPECFMPERFIDPIGCVDIDLAQNVVPFSLGKRRCTGENLARQEVYLLFTSTIKQYDVSFPKNDENSFNFEKNVTEGVARTLKPVNFVFHNRMLK